MKLPGRSRWPTTPTAARALQEALAGRVASEDRLGPVRHVAGVDVAFAEGGATTVGAVAVLTYPGLELVDRAQARRRTRFPYVPGLLSFREIPAILAALGKLRITPDLLLCDGQGFAHPRRFGLACHLGVLLNTPSIGVAKSRLIGCHAKPEPDRGSWMPLCAGGEVIGAVLRTRARTSPVYVSIGHRISLPSAIAYVLACAPRYRLPETTRMADRLSHGLPPFPEKGS